MNVLIPLAPGFEQIEALTIVDVLRRAEINVTTVALTDLQVTTSHGVIVFADKTLMDIESSDYDSIVLPGGMPGSKNLMESDEIINIVKEFNSAGKLVGAICAAPIVLGAAGVLEGKNYTCYPGFEKQITSANYNNLPFIVDGNIVTGIGPGAALSFSLKLVELMKSKALSNEIRAKMQVHWDEPSVVL